MNNIHKSRLQCERCHKSFSYEKRLEQHLDACRVKGESGPCIIDGDKWECLGKILKLYMSESYPRSTTKLINMHEGP